MMISQPYRYICDELMLLLLQKKYPLLCFYYTHNLYFFNLLRPSKLNPFYQHINTLVYYLYFSLSCRKFNSQLNVDSKILCILLLYLSPRCLFDNFVILLRFKLWPFVCYSYFLLLSCLSQLALYYSRRCFNLLTLKFFDLL